MLVDFCLPVKNEEDILEAHALKLYNYLKSKEINYDWRIIIIVNGSNDNSLKIAQDLESRYPTNFKYKNILSGGKGLALKEYFKESQADILAFMDIDLAVTLDSLPDLINPILSGETDLVAGSRLLPESKINRSPLREFGSTNYNRLSRRLFKNNLTDLQCGFKAFTKDLYRDLAKYLRDDKWFLDTELMILAKHFGYKIKEIPVDWQENRYRKRISKVKKTEAYVFVKKLLKLKKHLKQIIIEEQNKKASLK